MDYLQEARRVGASDLHLRVGLPPFARVNGKLTALELPALTRQELNEVLAQLLESQQREALAQIGEIDTAYTSSSGQRYRINAFLEQEQQALVIRLLEDKIPTCAELGLPPALCNTVSLREGLVLICGATGSGKSTTLAALLEKINQEQQLHIITLEEPIEYLHPSKLSLISQREVGRDTRSFASGLRTALREDPDVILVGELRDEETMATALTAAETGHLVFATLHTQSTGAAIGRLIDSFPQHAGIIKDQLANCLQLVCCQELLPRLDGQGRVAAFEILVRTPALNNIIRRGELQQLSTYIQTGSQQGMISKEEYLKKLRFQGIIG